MFIAYHDPLLTTVKRHSNNERVSSGDALLRFLRIVVGCHDLPHALLYCYRLFNKQIALLLRPAMTVVTRPDFVKDCFR